MSSFSFPFKAFETRSQYSLFCAGDFKGSGLLLHKELMVNG